VEQQRNPQSDEGEDDDRDDSFQPLTPEQAQAWRARHPEVSVWPIVWGQAAMAALVAVLAWCVSGQASIGQSAAYGGLAVAVPAALFARAMTRQRYNANAALAALLMWEIVKIAVTVAMLLAAPIVVPQLHWLALLIGMIATMKTYWIALFVQSSVRKTD